MIFGLSIATLWLLSLGFTALAFWFLGRKARLDSLKKLPAKTRLSKVPAKLSPFAKRMGLKSRLRQLSFSCSSPPVGYCCGENMQTLKCHDLAVNPELLGGFCVICGKGVKWSNLDQIRERHGMVPIGTDLFEILNTLELDALERGILQSPEPLESGAVFTARLHGLEGYRDAPLLIKVDTANRTVVLAESLLTGKPELKLLSGKSS